MDDCGIAGRLPVGELGIGGGENDLADGFERDALVPRVEPDQRLAPGRGAIRSCVDIDRLVDGIVCRCLERVLYPALTCLRTFVDVV
jgi:hypothetical protein